MKGEELRSRGVLVELKLFNSTLVLTRVFGHPLGFLTRLQHTATFSRSHNISTSRDCLVVLCGADNCPAISETPDAL